MDVAVGDRDGRTGARLVQISVKGEILFRDRFDVDSSLQRTRFCEATRHHLPIDCPPDECSGLEQRIMRLAELADEERLKRGSLVDPIVVSLDEVSPAPVEWLWPGRIAIGKLTLLAGDPGLGKSLVTLDIAARVSRGIPWPDNLRDPNQPGDVVLLSAEDDLADTIRPRLDAAGADVSRIRALTAVRGNDEMGDYQRALDLGRDLAMLEQATLDGCRLIVIDPVSAYLGDTDSHKNANVRGLLAPLAEFAARRRVAILALTHLNKSSGGQAMYRASGSLAFIAAARAAWIVTKDKDDARRRLVLPIKNNLAEDTDGLAYTVMDDGAGPFVAWEAEAVRISADEALAVDDHREERTDREDAAHWLSDLLADGRAESRDVKTAAARAGHAWRTVCRAKKDIGVISAKEGFSAGAKWFWSLPTKMANPNEDGHRI